MAKMATSALLDNGFDVTWIIDHKEPDTPPYSDIITSFSHRGCNLNGGTEWLIEQLQLMYDHARGAEWVAKVDSDTLILERKWFDEVSSRGVDAIGFQSPLRAMFGFCYAMRTAIIPRLIEMAKAWENTSRIIAEDLIVAELLSNSGFKYQRMQFIPSQGVWSFWRGTPGTEEYLGTRFQIVCVQRPAFTKAGQERVAATKAMADILKTYRLHKLPIEPKS